MKHQKLEEEDDRIWNSYTIGDFLREHRCPNYISPLTVLGAVMTLIALLLIADVGLQIVLVLLIAARWVLGHVS